MYPYVAYIMNKYGIRDLQLSYRYEQKSESCAIGIYDNTESTSVISFLFDRRYKVFLDYVLNIDTSRIPEDSDDYNLLLQICMPNSVGIIERNELKKKRLEREMQ